MASNAAHKSLWLSATRPLLLNPTAETAGAVGCSATALVPKLIVSIRLCSSNLVKAAVTISPATGEDGDRGCENEISVSRWRAHRSKMNLFLIGLASSAGWRRLIIFSIV